MTRINADLPPHTLHWRHLIAEYREIPMVLASLRRSLKTPALKIPPAFTLGTGHVSFFYDKLAFLQRRYAALIAEMTRRGYRPDPLRPIDWSLPQHLFNDWQAAPRDNELVLQRIAERIRQKPHLYRTQDPQP